MDDETYQAIKRQNPNDKLRSVYNASVKRKVTFIVLCIAILFVLFFAAIAIGSVDMPITQVFKTIGHIFAPEYVGPPDHAYYIGYVKSRSYRAILCILTGISLAAAGTIMQGILRNPLVSPFTLGVSSAASFGAAMGIVFWPILFGTVSGGISIFHSSLSYQDIFTMILAFLFGLVSILFVIVLSHRSDISRSTIILAGVIVSYLFQAGVSLAKYLSDDEALREITNWLLGGMWNASLSTDVILIPIVAVCVIYLESLAPKINVLAAGDDVAESLGVNVKKLRNTGLLVSTLMTSVCMAFTGIIGFVGLMAPHLCRMIIGNDTKYLIPASALIGSIIVLASDILGRVVLRPDQLPVGIFMYLIGGAFFIWMMLSKKKDVKM